MINILVSILQSILIIALAPLFLGILKKIKANLRGYKGATIFQVYYDYSKLLSKSSIRSNYSSFITNIGPVLALSASITVAFMVPVFYADSNMTIGNLIIIVFLLGYVKFFNTLIGLECSSTFGGMGSSRELFLSMLVEPVIFTIIMFLYLEDKSFNVFTISAINASGSPVGIGNILAAVAFFMMLIVENSRLPIDNPETHLELTMIHEAMILDLSGRDLLFAEMSSNIKLTIFITLFINIFVPFGLTTVISPGLLLQSILFFIVKFILSLLILAFVEIMMAKSRLFRAPDLIAAAFSIVIAAIAINHFL